MDARAQRQLFDSLLLIKTNLLRMNENGSCVEHASESADVGAGSSYRV